MYLQFLETALFVLAYLLGSIPFGKFVASSYGIDIQKRGSGNIGFANVRRVVGWRAGLTTLALDIIKGFVPTIMASYFVDATFAFFIGVMAVAGHVFPIWLKFLGGKGIATGLGVILALNPLAGLVGAAVYVISCFITKVSSYSSMAGLVATTGTALLLPTSVWWQYVIFIIIALWTLRHNLTGKVPNYDT